VGNLERSLEFLVNASSEVVEALKARFENAFWVEQATYLFSVAQIFNLPYRGMAFRRGSTGSRALELAEALPIANRRYGRVQLCATAKGTLNTYQATGLLRRACRNVRRQVAAENGLLARSTHFQNTR